MYLFSFENVQSLPKVFQGYHPIIYTNFTMNITILKIIDRIARRKRTAIYESKMNAPAEAHQTLVIKSPHGIPGWKGRA